MNSFIVKRIFSPSTLLSPVEENTQITPVIKRRTNKMKKVFEENIWIMAFRIASNMLIEMYITWQRRCVVQG